MRLYSSMAALTALACLAADAGGGSAADAAAADTAAAETAAKAPAPGKVKKVHMVWCGPGHAAFGIGMMVRAGPDQAEGLRNSGQARVATDDEVKAHTARKADIHDLG